MEIQNIPMSLASLLTHSALTLRLASVTRRDPKSIAGLAQRRLRELLQVAAARSSFYRVKYRGIDVTRAPLTDLPTTTKAELREHFDQVVTDPQVRRDDVEAFVADHANLGRWFRGQYAVSHTSGSQGPPLLIVQDRRAIEITFALMSARANAVGRPGLREGLRRLRNPARIAVITMDRGFFPSGAAFEFMPEIVGPFVDPLRLSSMQADLIDRLNDFSPHVIVGYASVLEALVRQRTHLRLPHLRQLSSSCEQLTPSARQRIERALRVPVLDHYGTGECLLLSDGCPTNGGAHINADWAILEVVDVAGRPVPPGTLGSKVLVTNLANRVQPFIRYEIGDRVALATRPCQCGSRLPRIERIEGRDAEVFWIRDGQRDRLLSGVLFHHAADSLRDIREWQVEQVERNRLEVRLELVPGASLAEEGPKSRFLQKLHELGLPQGVATEVHIVSNLGPDRATGKMRRMISHVGPPQDQSTDEQEPTCDATFSRLDAALDNSTGAQLSRRNASAVWPR